MASLIADVSSEVVRLKDAIGVKYRDAMVSVEGLNNNQWAHYDSPNFNREKVQEAADKIQACIVAMSSIQASLSPKLAPFQDPHATDVTILRNRAEVLQHVESIQHSYYKQASTLTREFDKLESILKYDAHQIKNAEEAANKELRSCHNKKALLGSVAALISGLVIGLIYALGATLALWEIPIAGTLFIGAVCFAAFHKYRASKLDIQPVGVT